MAPFFYHAQFGAFDRLSHRPRGHRGTNHVQSSLHYDHGPISHPPEIIEQFIRAQEEVIGKEVQLDLYAGQNFRSRPGTSGSKRISRFHYSRLIVAPAPRRCQCCWLIAVIDEPLIAPDDRVARILGKVTPNLGDKAPNSRQIPFDFGGTPEEHPTQHPPGTPSTMRENTAPDQR